MSSFSLCLVCGFAALCGTYSCNIVKLIHTCSDGHVTVNSYLYLFPQRHVKQATEKATSLSTPQKPMSIGSSDVSASSGAASAAADCEKLNCQKQNYTQISSAKQVTATR